MCLQPHAANVLHRLLLSRKHHHETDREQVRPTVGSLPPRASTLHCRTCLLLLCLFLVFQTSGKLDFLDRFSCNSKFNCIQVSSSFREPMNTKLCIQSTEDDFGWGRTLDAIWATQLVASPFPWEQPSSSVFYRAVPLFTLQGGHRWRLKGAEKGYPWRRHVDELGPGDGKSEPEDPAHWYCQSKSLYLILENIDWGSTEPGSGIQN